MSAPADGTSDESVACDVVIVSYNQRQRLLAALASVREAAAGLRPIVVDNDSADGSADAVRDAFPDVDLIALPRNIGFGAAVNRGVAHGSAPRILLLNNDARLRPEAYDLLARALDTPRVVACGPRLCGPEEQVELSVDRTLSPWNEAWFRIIETLYRDGRGPLAPRVRASMAHTRPVRSLSGACLLLQRNAFERIGGFDERFFLYAEDVDLCLRLRREGGKLMYVADAVVDHDRGASSATDPTRSMLHYRRSQIAFYRKHHGGLATSLLRAYLGLRFAFRRLLAPDPRRRQLAGDLLRLVWRETGD